MNDQLTILRSEYTKYSDLKAKYIDAIAKDRPFNGQSKHQLRKSIRECEQILKNLEQQINKTMHSINVEVRQKDGDILASKGIDQKGKIFQSVGSSLSSVAGSFFSGQRASLDVQKTRLQTQSKATTQANNKPLLIGALILGAIALLKNN